MGLKLVTGTTAERSFDFCCLSWRGSPEPRSQRNLAIGIVCRFRFSALGGRKKPLISLFGQFPREPVQGVFWRIALKAVGHSHLSMPAFEPLWRGGVGPIWVYLFKQCPLQLENLEKLDSWAELFKCRCYFSLYMAVFVVLGDGPMSKSPPSQGLG